jgi:hypothetical protein
MDDEVEQLRQRFIEQGRERQLVDSVGTGMKMVFATLPRCPACDSANLHTTHSAKNGDGTKTQNKRCRSCRHAFELVWE